MAKLDEKIGFIGGGNMAFAIGAGLIKRGKVEWKEFRIFSFSNIFFPFAHRNR